MKIQRSYYIFLHTSCKNPKTFITTDSNNITKKKGKDSLETVDLVSLHKAS